MNTFSSSSHEDDSIGFSSSLSTASLSDDETDEEYLQALEILSAIRHSPTLSRQQQQSLLRKRESLSCLQDLLPESSHLHQSPRVYRGGSDDDNNNSQLSSSSSWGFFMESRQSKPPLFRPPLRRSSQHAASRRVLPRQQPLAGKACC